MAKNKKKGLADRIDIKKKAKTVKKLNPFEIHINKKKMQVLGQKSKNDYGLPGVSRAKALNKRKNTLLQEYKTQNKSNKFIDRRIGERNSDLSENERAIARFVAQRSKEYKKKFVLDELDTEDLTHRGQTLNEIEKFEDPRSDDEDSLDLNDDKSGKLDANFVEDGHFGGGMLTRTGIEGAKSHKDLINELISESKKRKAEKQKTKERTIELTEKLDSEWTDLIPLLRKSAVDKSQVVKKPEDDYDKLLKKFEFQSVMPATERLKSVDEVAKEEKDKLEQLEKDRLARMQGLNTKKAAAAKHRSADDLDDDFVFDDDDQVMLSYNEQGVSNVMLENREENESEEVQESESEDEVETASEDDLSDLKEESSDSEDEEVEETTSKRKNSAQEKKVEKRKLTEDVSDSEEEEGVEMTKKRKNAAKQTEVEKRKLPEDIGDSENEEVEETTRKRKNAAKETKVEKRKLTEDFSDEEIIDRNDESDNEEEIESEKEDDDAKQKEKIKMQEEMMEKARNELPYTFEIPKSYEDLHATLAKQSSEHHSVIIERMIKCNHSSLAETNKEKLEMLFVYLLQYINDIVCDNSIKDSFKIFSSLVPQLFDLSQLTKVYTHKSIREVLVEKQSDYRKNRKTFPDINVLLFLKLVGSIFPTSDFRHSVVTPTFVFIEQMLRTCKLKAGKHIAYGLFLVALVVEYTVLSKRYLPGAINFLAGILHMAIPKATNKKVEVLPPFNPNSTLLVLTTNNSASKMSLKMDSSDLMCPQISDDLKIRSLYTTIKLIGEFRENFKELSSRCEIFEKILQYLELILVDNYPKEVQKEINHLIASLKLDKSERKLDFVVMEAQKPKALRLYEPNIQKVYDFKRHKYMSKEKAEHEKLLYKIKKEKKGALREIRKDKNFLGRVRINDKIRGDQQRKRKVKQIYAEASVQQGELKKFDRKKKWKK